MKTGLFTCHLVSETEAIASHESIWFEGDEHGTSIAVEVWDGIVWTAESMNLSIISLRKQQD